MLAARWPPAWPKLGATPSSPACYPRPAASILVRRLGLDLAAVVSASHNPWRDNGIKFFAADGGKLDAEAERAIEARIAAGAEGGGSGGVRPHARGEPRRLPARAELRLPPRPRRPPDRPRLRQRRHLRGGAGDLRRLGAEVEVIAAEPDGRNINAGCGSTHPTALVELVGGGAAEIGFAFDGDGDRVVAVDGRGRVRDGDELIALAALHLKRRGELHGGGVAVTVMTNYGFHQAMAEAGIEVGDDRRRRPPRGRGAAGREWALGGEQSGHIIWTDYAPTGDGVAAALLVLAALGDAPLADVEPFTRLPQVLVNVEVADRDGARRGANRCGPPSTRRPRRSRAAGGSWSGRRAPSRSSG